MWKAGERIPGYVETWGENTWICGNMVREYNDLWNMVKQYKELLKDGKRILGFVKR